MIVYIIGTKAQYIKMAPVVLETIAQGLPFRLVLTGQHSETFDDLQQNFGLPPADLTLVDGSEAKDRISFARWIWRSFLAARLPRPQRLWRQASVIVVHGDTASALLGAGIGWSYRRPVVHVEAGLRSFNYLHPFPEELIRVLVSHIATLHLCPDAVAAKNLQGARGECLVTDGNTLKDALRLALKAARPPAARRGRPYAVFSAHRQENLFNSGRLEALLDLLRKLTGIVDVKFVLHPVTRKRLEQLGLIDALRQQPGLELVPRMDFFGFIGLIGGAAFVATDGGSNQEECAMLDIPCVLLRQATERPDGLDTNVLLGDLDEARILAFAQQHLVSERELGLRDAYSPSARIVERLAGFLGGSSALQATDTIVSDAE
jgi:UDP-N-acetylglucosamine 2-epimerase (non-hydrolysing)